MNVDIFVCIHFCGFLKMGNLVCIKNHVFTITASLGFYKCYSHGVYIFADIEETRIMRKYVQRENFYFHSRYYDTCY